MKKVAVLLLMFFYLIPAIGVTVSVHYCGGKVTSVSLNPFDAKRKCPCGSKKMKKDCCRDKNTTIKLDTVQKNTQQIFNYVDVKFTELQTVILTKLFFEYNSVLSFSEISQSSHPPDRIRTPLYILLRIFII